MSLNCPAQTLLGPTIATLRRVEWFLSIGAIARRLATVPDVATGRHSALGRQLRGRIVGQSAVSSKTATTCGFQVD